MTYFVMNSLRQAGTKLINRDEPITIRVQNLVKIYDREKQFTREWKKGDQIRTHSGLIKGKNVSIPTKIKSYFWRGVI